MGFRSIQTKYILLVLCCVVASALLIGGVCVRNATEISVRETAQNMNLTCESYMYKYDRSLSNVQSAVQVSATFAGEALDSIERFANDEAYRDEYAKRLEDVLRLETLDASIVRSYYVRFSPDLLSYERGFRFVRPSDGQPFERMEVVKIQDYHEGDDEHVSWYYTPIEAGSIVWLEPYYNANFGIQMVSCVAPFYKNGELVGVVGMDIDFSRLVNDLDDLRIFDNGYAFLCSPEGKIYYHPLYDSGTYIQQDVEGFDAQLADESSGEKLYSGVSKGENIEYAFRTLTNGMKLVLRAPEAEISADARSVIRSIALVVVVIVAVSLLVTVLIGRRITKPLRQLTDAAGRMSQGDYDIDLTVKTNDEVARLAHTLQDASVQLKDHAEYLRQLAYRDSLTGVRNKTAYNLEVERLEQSIADGSARFGLAVFDVNDLKTANDKYGHEQGDKVIKAGCSRVCLTFVHSPVFRVGGDEFVAILEGDDLEHLDERLHQFERRGEIEAAVADHPRDIVRMAVGVAIYDAAADTCVQDVFNRADAEMYREKNAMKQGER